MKDKNNVILTVGQTVNVPAPNASDIHNNAFTGIVADILEDRGTAIVEDNELDFFEIEGNRLEIVEN